MPEMTSSCVCASRRKVKVGSSSAILASPTEIFGSSSRVFGSTARGTIGVGNLIGSSITCGTGPLPAVETVSEMCRSSNLAIGDDVAGDRLLDLLLRLALELVEVARLAGLAGPQVDQGRVVRRSGRSGCGGS